MRNVENREVSADSITIQDASAEDIAIYRWALERGRLRLPADRSKAAGMLQLDETVCQAAIDRLMAWRLLVPAAEDSTELRPTNPEQGSAELTAKLMAEIRTRQHDVHLLRSMFEAFAIVYAENEARGVGGVPYKLLDTPAAVRDALEVASQRCRDEVVAIQPGGSHSDQSLRLDKSLRLTLSRDLRLLRRGVRVRILCQHTARYDQNTRAYLERVVAGGSQVRTRDRLPCTLIAFDRQVVFLPVTGNAVGAVMVGDPSTVDFASAIFDGMWEEAQEYLSSKRQDREISAKLQRAIIDLLLQGMKDEVIARRLGISVRTCRRHISAIMDQFGATSRFQAGALIQQLTQTGKTGEEHGLPAH
jgi:DNA-binding CsgD family transcriptional regulator